ncbi:MAG: choline-binding protein D, partial [Pauljensenia sp.]
SGAMLTGWQQIGRTWYYFASDGHMVTGWQTIDGRWYLFAPSGAWI